MGHIILLSLFLVFNALAAPNTFVMHYSDAVVVYEAEGFETIGKSTSIAINPKRTVYTPEAYSQKRLSKLLDKASWLRVYDLRDFAILARTYRPVIFSVKPVIEIEMTEDTKIEAVFEKVDEHQELVLVEQREVYRSRTGARYHTRDCQYAGAFPIKVTIEEAEELGLTPCGHCKPISIEESNE